MWSWIWSYLPTEVEERGADFLRIASWIAAAAAISTIYHRSPFRKALRWIWRRNVSGPLRPLAVKLIQDAAQPLVDRAAEVTRAASLEQHDAQNEAISEGFRTVNERLDKGAETMTDLGNRITAVEDIVTNPPKRQSRTRQDDQ